MTSPGCRTGAVLGFCFVFVPLVSCELSPLSTYVTPVGIEIRRTDALRHVTVRYQASSKPRIKWNVDSLGLYESSSDITLINDFSESTNNGIAIMMMPTGHFRPDPPTDMSVDLMVEEFDFYLKFKTRDIMDSENFDYSLNSIYNDIGPNTVLEYVKGEPLSISLSLRSGDLSMYEIGRSIGRIDSFDYGIFPPERIQWWSWTRGRIDTYLDSNRDLKPFQCAGTFEDINATSLMKQCSLNTTIDYVSGKGTFDLILKTGEGNPIIKQIYISREFYIQEVGQSAPYRENTLLVFRSPQYSAGDSDVSISNWRPTFKYRAIGYPKPQIHLKRGCETTGETVMATEVGGRRYETTMQFKFLNITALPKWETYIIVARSGNLEISDSLSIENSYNQ